MSLIEQVRAKIADALARRDAAQAQLEGTVAAAESENRADLTDDEAAAFAEARAAVVAIDDTELTPLREREAELVEMEQRRSAAAETPRPETGTVRVGNEPDVYTSDAERTGRASFLRDLVNRHEDPSAADRLRRHQAMSDAEVRGIGTGAFAGLSVPAYLTDLVAPLRRAGRPTADICNRHPLPPEGMTVNISRITTGTAVATQQTENTAVQETDADDTLLTIPVRTIAGMQDVSRQAIDRGPGIDSIVVEDLARAYNTELDRQVVNGSGASGEHLGIRSTVGIVSVTYTDGTPTAAEAWPKLADLVQQIQSGVFMGPSHFVVHPRRWWWFAKEVGTTFPFLNLNLPTVQGGNLGGPEYEATNRSLMGLPVVVDGNVSTALGGATPLEDAILGVTDTELHLWEEADAPLFIRAEQPLANQLSVRFVAYGYSAFTAGRYPGAHGVIGGTGLNAPTF